MNDRTYGTYHPAMGHVVWNVTVPDRLIPAPLIRFHDFGAI